MPRSKRAYEILLRDSLVLLRSSRRLWLPSFSPRNQSSTICRSKFSIASLRGRCLFSLRKSKYLTSASKSHVSTTYGDCDVLRSLRQLDGRDLDAAGITIFGIIARVPLVPEQAHIPIWVKQVQSSLFHYCFTPFPRDHIAILIEHPTALLSFIILILIIGLSQYPF